MIEPLNQMITRIRAEMDLPGDPAGHRVVVAMSGGVDSSVVAGLVKAAGYEAVGITLQLYDHGEAVRRKGACCAGQDIHDARRVAAELGMPHYVLDFESRFRDSVMEDFAGSYLRGETPVPCVRCNQTVKFSDLLARARQLGASAVVTGHYVRSAPAGAGRRLMLTPDDMARDQSYFLFATTQAQLNFLRFPLAGLTKAETRTRAAELGLSVAAKPDSQDICFVPEGRYTDVIRRLRPDAVAPGEVVHLDGRVLGTHDGIAGFTIGQRKGLGVADGTPLYVIRIDPGNRRVIVGPKEALATRHVRLREFNWLGDDDPAAACHALFVKLRSTRPPSPARLARRADGAWRVSLESEEGAVSPGQACVFYSAPGAGARVLGGGIIEASEAGGEHGGESRPS